MSQININISTPNDGLGDPLRSAFNSTNQNFTDLYTNKVDKISGKGLSSNDYTSTEKTKLASIASGAEVNVQANLLQEDNTADDYVIGRDIISDFVPKTERFKVVVSTNSIGVTLNDGRHFLEFTNASQGQFNYLVLGTDFTGGENNPLIIRNNTGISFNIGHLLPSGSSFAGENLFFFPNLANFQIKNKEIISFVYDVDNNRYSYSGIITTNITTTVTNIVSSALASQNSAGMATWINSNSFTVANNEIKQFQVTDTGQVFELLLRGRSFGSATPAISYIDVLDYGGTGVSLSANNTWTGIQTFLATKLGLRNVADTFTSFFTNVNTASRTYTLPNKDMTFAGTDEVLLLAGNQSFTGSKTTTISGTETNSFRFTNLSTITGSSSIDIEVSTTGSGNGQRGISIINNNSGANAAGSQGIYISNNSTGNGYQNKNLSSGVGNDFQNLSSGVMTNYNSQTGSTGDLIQFKKSNSLTAKVNQNGEFTAPKYNLNALHTAPSSATDTGVLGEIRYDANYMYVCVATNTWKRSAITTW
jgi:hypothetical protein